MEEKKLNILLFDTPLVMRGFTKYYTIYAMLIPIAALMFYAIVWDGIFFSLGNFHYIFKLLLEHSTTQNTPYRIKLSDFTQLGTNPYRGEHLYGHIVR